MTSQANDLETIPTNPSEPSSDKLKDAIDPPNVDKPKQPNTSI